MQWEFTEDTFPRLWSFLPVFNRGERQSWASLLKVGFEAVVIKKWLITGRCVLWFHSWKLHCVSNVIFLHEEQRQWALQPLPVCRWRWPALRIIQAVYSLEGFSLSRHLAPSLQPPASPAPRPGTQPLLRTGASQKWKTPCCWDTAREKRQSSVH